jgi:hypothetical protein
MSDDDNLVMIDDDCEPVSRAAVAEYLSDMSKQLAALAFKQGFLQSAAYFELARLSLSAALEKNAKRPVSARRRKAG